MNRLLSLLALAALAGHAPVALRADEMPPAAKANLERVAAWDAENRQACADTNRYLLRRNVRADRQARTVAILAESCGLAANATVEFGIVGETSDRAYEALLRTYARATDLAAALEFIGLPRGRNVGAKAQRFWPTGERVAIHVERPATTNAPLPLEAFILDRKTGEPLAQRHFVYCGSPRVPALDGEDGEICLADREAPCSILSTYNEPQTLLDVPRQASQGEVYENYVANPGLLLPEHELVRLVLSPETRPDGRPRLRPMALLVTASEVPGGLAFELREPSPAGPAHFQAFGELLKRLMAVVDESCDPMVSLVLDDAIPLRRAREICKVIQKIEGENGVRMEPPPAGQIFYKSFLPDERKERLSQPWELHVGPGAATNALPELRLVKTLEDWSDPNSIDPKLTPVDFPLRSFDDLPVTLEKEGRGLPVMLVYAPADAPIGLFMQGLRRIRETHPTVYVFAEP